ncbi:NlpC/P60 family protein [Streptomyces decoyicus]|uniref:peptidase M23 n=1 Tax=Streptomyces decoyicus TaxID=249567 RepID=UPI0036467672
MDQRQVAQIAMQASGVAKKGLMLKVGVVAGVLFFVGLLLMGALMPTPSAEASTCEDTGPGTGPAAPDTTSANASQVSRTIHQQQLTHAKTIDKVAKKLRLPGKATLIALMTAMQESTLQNLDHGHADSIGLFQQRPAAKWGTEAQIMKPEFAATSFFQGRGGNKGLKDIANWQTRPPGEVAQAVQKSAHPELYAGHESVVRGLAKEAGINLGRKGTSTGNGSSQADDASSGETPSTCKGTDTDESSGSGTTTKGKFKDGKNDGWPAPVHNPRTTREAIAWARGQTNAGRSWERLCLRFVSTAYGYGPTRQYRAIEQWGDTSARMKHPGDRHPPPGALMYWSTGKGRAGHVAIYLGGGKIASNDIERVGYIDIVPASEIEAKWGSTYLGWTVPLLP